MTSPLDAQARKQLLLTRIALERAEWVREVDALRRHLTPAEIVGSLLQRAGGGGLATALFGHRGDAGAAAPGWAGRVMALVLAVRRHPLWWPVMAGVWPWLRKRRAAPGRPRSSSRLLLGALGVAGAAFGGWWLWRGGRGGGRGS